MINSEYFNEKSSSAPLAVFRIGFGLLMCYSIIRFWLKGWIETLYIQPKFHFSYYGFEWVKPLEEYTYILFMICGVSALLVALGLKYRFEFLLAQDKDNTIFGKTLRNLTPEILCKTNNFIINNRTAIKLPVSFNLQAGNTLPEENQQIFLYEGPAKKHLSTTTLLEDCFTIFIFSGLM